MSRAGCLALLAVVAGSACTPDVGRRDRATLTYLDLLDTEDARPVGGEGLAFLMEATLQRDPLLRATAVRALGRLEDPVLAGPITEHLEDPDPDVRVAAAWALAQSLHRVEGGQALAPLMDLADVESDPRVRAEIARSLGRLDLDPAQRRRAVRGLLALSEEGGLDAPGETLVGVALGLESAVRLSGDEGLGREAADRLGELMTYGLDTERVEAGRIRALAVDALGRSRRLGVDLVRRALADPEPEVRRVALGFLDAVVPSRRGDLVASAFTDESPRVVIAAIDYVAGQSRDAPACRHLLAAAAPPSAPSVRVQALRALSLACPQGVDQRRTLIEAASEIGVATAWQPAAAALTSLFRLDRSAAAELLPRFTAHPSPFVRAHAARAAGAGRDATTLRHLARDPSPNVRAAALRSLFDLEGHGVDELLLEQLSQDDPGLLVTVSGLLEGSPSAAETAEAALGAFERISAAERETWRDPRRALLERVTELGWASLSGRLEPFLGDFDPLVAADVASTLEAWTGRPHEPEPRALPRAPLPSAQELEMLQGTHVTLHMRDHGPLVIETLPDLALTNVHRLARLAGTGYFDGLTFHRWAPNFVIQGGSPGANEFSGHGPYTRDELGGTSHWRGTVGVSTRGRDTGDAQIFINLVDNVRLDHDYTVIGRVVEGLDVVDEVMEGDVIERAEVAGGR